MVSGAIALVWCGTLLQASPPCVSGIYPHLAFFNQEAECGIGAVVPWAGRLWAVTYAPHAPQGSTDKLYEIGADLSLTVRPESVGGTHAGRLLHRESNQLLIGPYVIDAGGSVRVIAPARMPGRLTGVARHLTKPDGKVYYATMEEGFYEVDVRSLEVVTLYPDFNGRPDAQEGGVLLPGCHGKGLYSGQGVLVYANNGERSPAALTQPFIPSGCLAEWDGRDWHVIRRSQFTEVSGPGGLYGNEDLADPIWSIGWDHRSLILMLREAGAWRPYRLPKASHTYDGAHGWNTEWPRIRDVGEDDLLMTMHGMFWRFPRTFAASRSGGIVPRSTYLKVVGDFCRWGDRIVFGCDDTARNRFLNTRRAQGTVAPPQSQSNLWFVEPGRLDQLGPAVGRGAVWLEEQVDGGQASDPFLFSGFHRQSLYLFHESGHAARIRLDVDVRGDGRWTRWREVQVPPRALQWWNLSAERAAWIRLSSDRPLVRATAWFQGAKRDDRAAEADPIFAGLARPADAEVTGGTVRALGDNRRTLRLAALAAGPAAPRELGCYELDGELRLRRVPDEETRGDGNEHAAIPGGVLAVEAASVLFVTDEGQRFRLPRGDAALDREGPLGPYRVDREVCTERDLFNAHGTFYELPAENAGGFARIRPVATHNRLIHDYCSYRGLLVMSGVALSMAAGNPHIVRSDDGQAALWVGAVDDLWKLGKPRGRGGPWLDSPVQAGRPSDPFLFTGYDRKRVSLSHRESEPVRMRLEFDLTGTGLWVTYREFPVPPGRPVEHVFPDAFAACWVRAVADGDGVCSAQFTYE